MSKSTHIPWVEFFEQDNWYSDLFIKYGGLFAYLSVWLGDRLILTAKLVFCDYCFIVAKCHWYRIVFVYFVIYYSHVVTFTYIHTYINL